MLNLAKNLKTFCQSNDCKNCRFSDFHVITDKFDDEIVENLEEYQCPTKFLIGLLEENSDVKADETKLGDITLIQNIIGGLNAYCDAKNCELCRPMEFVVSENKWNEYGYDYVSKCVKTAVLNLFEEELEYWETQ